MRLKAHQWFGNLVSPAWWTHIWLNEGFATFFAAIGAEHTNPEFEPRKRFLNDAVQRSMEHAADPAIAHSVKIGEIEWIFKGAMEWFDRMAYDQASSLIRMMDGFISSSLFTAGLKIYLSRLEYGAAQQDDLFRDLNTMAHAGEKIPAHLTMKAIMDTWTLKAGFPLVRVSKASSTRIYVSQVRSDFISIQCYRCLQYANAYYEFFTCTNKIYKIFMGKNLLHSGKIMFFHYRKSTQTTLEQ